MSDLPRIPSSWHPIALSLLRFVSGLIFLEHGTAKLFGWPAVAALTQMQHLPPLILASAVLELVGGALVCVGLFTRPAAFVISGEMAIGYFMVHAPKSVFPIVNGGDAAILYCFIFLFLFVAGPGSISLDRLIFGPRDVVRTSTRPSLSA